MAHISHASHPEVIKRLKRAEGHLRTVIQMMEDQRACLDLAQQLHAIEKAVAAAKKTLIHDHIDHCLAHAADADDDDAVLVLIEGRAEVIDSDAIDDDEHRGALEVISRADLVERLDGEDPSDHEIEEQAATLDATVDELGG